LAILQYVQVMAIAGFSEEVRLVIAGFSEEVRLVGVPCGVALIRGKEKGVHAVRRRVRVYVM
jgi:hypothetical protein